MKRMTESRLRKIAKALGWGETCDRNGNVYWKGTNPAILADEIAAGWAKAGLVVFASTIDRSWEVELRLPDKKSPNDGGKLVDITSSKRLSAAILAVACEWADAGCPGGKA